MDPGRRRISVVALIVAGCATLGAVAPASAATTTTCTPLSLQGKDQLRCVTETVATATNQVVTRTNEVVATTVTATEITEATRFVPSTQTVFERTNTTGPCQVGQSGRVGTAPGFETQEVLVTTTQEFLDTTTKTFDVTTTRTFLVTTTQTFLKTTTTTTTEVFSGKRPDANKLLSTDTTTGVVTQLTNTDVQRTLTDTKVDRVLKNTDVSTRLIDTTVTRTNVGDPQFTQTGKCRNVSGPQPQTRA